jgi:hypothetical protein
MPSRLFAEGTLPVGGEGLDFQVSPFRGDGVSGNVCYTVHTKNIDNIYDIRFTIFYIYILFCKEQNQLDCFWQT